MVVSRHGGNVAAISKSLGVCYNNVVDVVQKHHALEMVGDQMFGLLNVEK
jgi:hypothetical protein